jgi:hypothetical protein
MSKHFIVKTVEIYEVELQGRKFEFHVAKYPEGEEVLEEAFAEDNGSVEEVIEYFNNNF